MAWVFTGRASTEPTLCQPVWALPSFFPYTGLKVTFLITNVLIVLRQSCLPAYWGRPSIIPEMLLRALLLQPLFSIASERLLMEQFDCNLLFRWFVGLGMHAEVWDAMVFSKNPEWQNAGRSGAEVVRGSAGTGRAERGCCRTSTSRSKARDLSLGLAAQL